jgi:hypothetical protein
MPANEAGVEIKGRMKKNSKIKIQGKLKLQNSSKGTSSGRGAQGRDFSIVSA